MSQATVAKLKRTARQVSQSGGRQVTAMQVAAQLPEEAVTRHDHAAE